MSANDDLFKAMGMFTEGVQDLQRNRSLDAAMQQVNAIKTSELDESKQRAAVQQVSNELSANLFKYGAQPAAIEQLRNSLSPQYKNPAEMIAMGATTGNESLIQAGQKADIAATAGDMAKLKYTSDQAMKLQQLKGQQEMQTQAIKNMGTEGKLPVNEVVDKFSTALSAEKGLKSMLVEMKKSPGLVGPIDQLAPKTRAKFDAKFAHFRTKSKQLFDQYRVAVTGAGASTSELKMLEESFPVGNETEDAYKAKTEAALEMGRNLLSSRADALEASGYRTSGLRALLNKGQAPNLKVDSSNEPAWAQFRKSR